LHRHLPRRHQALNLFFVLPEQKPFHRGPDCFSFHSIFFLQPGHLRSPLHFNFQRSHRHFRKTYFRHKRAQVDLFKRSPFLLKPARKSRMSTLQLWLLFMLITVPFGFGQILMSPNQKLPYRVLIDGRNQYL
jgi:hypothetical protein